MTQGSRVGPGAARWLLVLLLAVFGSAGIVAPAGAAARETVVPGTASSVDQEVLSFTGLLPGETVKRYLVLSVAEPGPGKVVRAEVDGSAGLLPFVLTGLRSCDVAWQAGECPSGEQTLLPFGAVPASQGLTVPVGARDTLYLEVAVGVSDDVPQGASGQLTYVVSLEGADEVPPSPTAPPSSGGATPPGGLSSTGADSLALLIAALSLIGLGAAARASVRRRREAT